MPGKARGLLIAAPASGSGKTLVTLALLRHFRNAGVAVASVKAGPDYIDPAFHSFAGGRACTNLDTWAMRPETIAGLVAAASEDAELLLGEGVMGLFDGAPDGLGSTADLARRTGWPVVLVIDAKGMGATAAAVVQGLAAFDPAVPVAGVIFNRVGGEGHRKLLQQAMAPLSAEALGFVPRDAGLVLPERHLGLVQAGEHADLEGFLERAAALVAQSVDLTALCALAKPSPLDSADPASPLPPLGQKVAVARDEAFAFCYPFWLESWRRQGAEIRFFSPLADEAPADDADAVFLPGGYPELHAGRLSGNRRFAEGLRKAAAREAFVYGECGGYMALGEGLVDAEGERHAMAGLLPLETSFAQRRLSLGYRELELCGDLPFGRKGLRLRGHEFHYAATLRAEGSGKFAALRDSQGGSLGSFGLVEGRVAGSFAHVVDRRF